MRRLRWSALSPDPSPSRGGELASKVSSAESRLRDSADVTHYRCPPSRLREGADHRPSRCLRLLPLVVVFLALLAALAPGGAGAHAFLDHSDPPANAVLPEPPQYISLWFTEPIEPQYSHAKLFDATGQQVET